MIPLAINLLQMKHPLKILEMIHDVVIAHHEMPRSTPIVSMDAAKVVLVSHFLQYNFVDLLLLLNNVVVL